MAKRRARGSREVQCLGYFTATAVCVQQGGRFDQCWGYFTAMAACVQKERGGRISVENILLPRAACVQQREERGSVSGYFTAVNGSLCTKEEGGSVSGIFHCHGGSLCTFRSGPKQTIMSYFYALSHSDQSANCFTKPKSTTDSILDWLTD
jgi:hypothetical protein